MGLYDMFHGNCPFCGKDYVGQTKFFECEMFCFEPGNTVCSVDNMRLEMKEHCIGCLEHPVAVIKDGVFLGFEKDNPTDREGHWGAILQVGEDRREVHDEMIKDAMEAEEK